MDGIEQAPTGSKAVPTFPKKIKLLTSFESTSRQIGDEIREDTGMEEEYHLLGLGIRTVSFIGIQVYVVGLYIAASDMAALQQLLVRQAATPLTSASNVADETAVSAISLVRDERETLKRLLLDPERGEQVWNQILKDSRIRTALRIVPTRNTDVLHLRDGWVRAITTRAKKANASAIEYASRRDTSPSSTSVPESEFADDSFGAALNDFKSLFGGGWRKNVAKGQKLLLLRDRLGRLDVLFQPASGKPLIWLGAVGDERISRLIWMAYLAGKNVASEGARGSVVDGVMETVERPVGTVEQRVG
jgi:hypothetical protein